MGLSDALQEAIAQALKIEREHIATELVSAAVQLLLNDHTNDPATLREALSMIAWARRIRDNSGKP
jgi:hypothetical protein